MTVIAEVIAVIADAIGHRDGLHPNGLQVAGPREGALFFTHSAISGVAIAGAIGHHRCSRRRY